MPEAGCASGRRWRSAASSAGITDSRWSGSCHGDRAAIQRRDLPRTPRPMPGPSISGAEDDGVGKGDLLAGEASVLGLSAPTGALRAAGGSATRRTQSRADRRNERAMAPRLCADCLKIVEPWRVNFANHDGPGTSQSPHFASEEGPAMGGRDARNWRIAAVRTCVRACTTAPAARPACPGSPSSHIACLRRKGFSVIHDFRVFDEMYSSFATPGSRPPANWPRRAFAHWPRRTPAAWPRSADFHHAEDRRRGRWISARDGLLDAEQPDHLVEFHVTCR